MVAGGIFAPAGAERDLAAGSSVVGDGLSYWAAGA